LPGGWADVNYSPAENITKELREETGYECTPAYLHHLDQTIA
jgi:ADP-ribose pyrophosphatase YjhB (NUDIX family)